MSTDAAQTSQLPTDDQHMPAWFGPTGPQTDHLLATVLPRVHIPVGERCRFCTLLFNETSVGYQLGELTESGVRRFPIHDTCVVDLMGPIAG